MRLPGHRANQEDVFTMKDIINGLIERFRRQHVQARRYVAMMLVLALLTTLS